MPPSRTVSTTERVAGRKAPSAGSREHPQRRLELHGSGAATDGVAIELDDGLELTD
jgi:hypothetical protein